MKSCFVFRAVVVFLTLGGLTVAPAEKYYGYDERDHHGGEHHMSGTEKAIAGAVIGALAVAAAKSAAKRGDTHPAAAYAPPQYVSPQSDYRAQEDVIVVRVPSVQGTVVPVYLKRTPSGFVGPRGEYYPSMPSAETLANFYGGWNRPAAGGPAEAPQVSVEQGKVRLIISGRTICSLRPAMPFVEKYKLVNSNQQIIIKSRANHGPATVELFNVSNGSLDDKVLAFAIKNGRPAWAKGWQD